jgi:hypothetical protein
VRSDICLLDELYEGTTLAEVLYMFSKGIKGVHLALTDNPRFYHGLAYPYNTAEDLGIRVLQSDALGSIPQKKPEDSLSAFLGTGNQNSDIHVYSDKAPRIELQLESAPWSLSLVKWSTGSTPGTILRGNIHYLYGVR